MNPSYIDLACANATLRRAARLVTQLYDAEFAGLIEAPQFALLAMIEAKPGCNQAMIVRVLGLDKTTVSRNLKLLARRGWIVKQERSWTLSDEGRNILAQARPRWKKAQDRFRSEMTEAQWNDMFATLKHITETAHRFIHEKGEKS